MLYLAFLGDLFQYVFRTITSLIGHPNLATHLASLSLLVSRVGASLGLLLIGFFIDTGVQYCELFTIYIIFTLLLGFTYLLISLFTEPTIEYVTAFINRYYKLDIAFTTHRYIKISLLNPKLDIIVVFSVGLLGFLIPSIAASIMPEFKATLLQTGFILNSFSTFYFILVIEKKLVLILNASCALDKWRSYKLFMYSRSIGCFFSGLLLLLFYYYINIIIKNQI